MKFIHMSINVANNVATKKIGKTMNYESKVKLSIVRVSS
jgi:hypothetical protein